MIFYHHKFILPTMALLSAVIMSANGENEPKSYLRKLPGTPVNPGSKKKVAAPPPTPMPTAAPTPTLPVIFFMDDSDFKTESVLMFNSFNADKVQEINFVAWIEDEPSAFQFDSITNYKQDFCAHHVVAVSSDHDFEVLESTADECFAQGNFEFDYQEKKNLQYNYATMALNCDETNTSPEIRTIAYYFPNSCTTASPSLAPSEPPTVAPPQLYFWVDQFGREDWDEPQNLAAVGVGTDHDYFWMMDGNQQISLVSLNGTVVTEWGNLNKFKTMNEKDRNIFFCDGMVVATHDQAPSDLDLANHAAFETCYGHTSYSICKFPDTKKKQYDDTRELLCGSYVQDCARNGNCRAYVGTPKYMKHLFRDICD